MNNTIEMNVSEMKKKFVFKFSTTCVGALLDMKARCSCPHKSGTAHKSSSIAEN